MAIPASNRVAVEATRPTIPVDFDAPFAPSTKTYHGFSIQVNGTSIGRITEWTPVAMDREFTHIGELNARTWGQPVDGVPGRATQFELSFARAEVWGEEIEVALGVASSPYTLLVDQNAPFSIDEVFFRGNTLYEQYRYLGCWFTNRSTDAFSSEGDAVVRISGTLAFVNRIKIL